VTIRNGSFPWPLQESLKKALCRTLITTRLNQYVDHVSVLIDCSPQVVLLAVDSHEDFIQMPDIAKATLSPLEFPRIGRTELLTPMSNGFIGDDDSALSEIFDVAETHTEMVIKPDGMTDDLRRKSVSVIAGSFALHRFSLPV
jgi:hypothetical protein